MPHEFDTVYEVVTDILADGHHNMIDARLGDMARRDDLSREHMLAFVVATMPHRGWLENRSAFLNNVHNVLVSRGEYDGILEGL